jgi:hypothetical protein
MLVHFLAASAIAAAFTTLGAMAVKIGVLTTVLQAMIALCIESPRVSWRPVS